MTEDLSVERAPSEVLSPTTATAWRRSFFVRLALIGAIVGIPIVGASWHFTSAVSIDIATATSERGSLMAYDSVAELFPLLESIHRQNTDAPQATQASQAPGALERGVARVERAYRSRGLSDGARARWNDWRTAWSRGGTLSAGSIDNLFNGLQELGTDLEPDSLLDSDSRYALRKLASSILRQEPRSFAALRQTIDAVADTPEYGLNRYSIEAIATARALEVQPLALNASSLAVGISLDPELARNLDSPFQASVRATTAYRSRVADVLLSEKATPADARAVEALGRIALDAHTALWRASRKAADRALLRRIDAAVARRRIVILFSIVAGVLGIVGIVLVGRTIADRDRVEIASAQLEADKLRAESAQSATIQALRLQEVQFKTVFENTDVGIVIFDVRGAIAQYNGAAKRILGASARAIIDDQRAAIAQFDLPDRAPFTVEKRCIARNGDTKWLSLTFSGAYLEGVKQMVILLMRDTTEDKLLAQRLRYEANHDSLTRIANRASFENALRGQLERCRLGEAFALAYIDLDSFKPINDTYGHAAGDAILVATAERLVSAVGDRDVCARLGGDEFAVLIRGTGKREELEPIAQRIGTIIAKPIAFGDRELSVTASIGIAIGSAQYASTHELKLDADAALYAVKERGRNGQRIFERHRDVVVFG